MLQSMGSQRVRQDRATEQHRRHPTSLSCERGFVLQVGGEQMEPLQLWPQPLILSWAGQVRGTTKTTLSVLGHRAGSLLFLRETQSRGQAAGGGGGMASPFPSPCSVPTDDAVAAFLSVLFFLFLCSWACSGNLIRATCCFKGIIPDISGV